MTEVVTKSNVCSVCKLPITSHNSYVYYGSDNLGNPAFAHRNCVLTKSETDKPPSLYVFKDKSLGSFYYRGGVEEREAAIAVHLKTKGVQ